MKFKLVSWGAGSRSRGSRLATSRSIEGAKRKRARGVTHGNRPRRFQVFSEASEREELIDCVVNRGHPEED